MPKRTQPASRRSEDADRSAVRKLSPDRRRELGENRRGESSHPSLLGHSPSALAAGRRILRYSLKLVPDNRCTWPAEGYCTVEYCVSFTFRAPSGRRDNFFFLAFHLLTVFRASLQSGPVQRRASPRREANYSLPLSRLTSSSLGDFGTTCEQPWLRSPAVHIADGLFWLSVCCRTLEVRTSATTVRRTRGWRETARSPLSRLD